MCSTAVRRRRRWSAARPKRCGSSPRAPAATSRSSAALAASRDEHDRAVRAFAQAVAEGSLEGLVAVLDPDAVWTSDGGGRVTAARKPLRGGARVARVWAAFSRRATHEPVEVELNGLLGLVVPSNDGHRAALSFVVGDGRITRIDAVRNPEKLRRLGREPEPRAAVLCRIVQGSPWWDRVRIPGSRHRVGTCGNTGGRSRRHPFVWGHR